MTNSKNNNPFPRMLELLNMQDSTAEFYLAKEYDKEQLAKLATHLQRQLKSSQTENLRLQVQISNSNQQQPRAGNQESLVLELEQRCNEANNRYFKILKQYEDSMKEFSEIEKQKKATDELKNDYIATLKQQISQAYQKSLQYHIDTFQVSAEQKFQLPQNQQYQKQFSNFEKSFKEVSVQCSDTIQHMKTIINKQKENSNEDWQFSTQFQCYQDTRLQIKRTQQLMEQVVKELANFLQEKNITDLEITNKFDDNIRILQLNQKILNEFDKMIDEFVQDISKLEKKNKILVQENNKLNKRVENFIKTQQKEICEQQPIIQELRQTQNMQRINQNQRIQLFAYFNKLKSASTLLNDQFYHILLLFVTQGLTITDLQQQLQNQNQVVEMVINIKQQIQSQIPTSFQQILQILTNFKQFFDGIKQYITNQNKLGDVFQIQDKFFDNYEKVINELSKIENIQNQIDSLIGVRQN